jgi:hypothetical protein
MYSQSIATEIAYKIPVSLQETLMSKLVDLILTSSNTSAMPSSLAKDILYNWHKNGLRGISALELILGASLKLEPVRTAEILKELGMADLASRLQAQ